MNWVYLIIAFIVIIWIAGSGNKKETECIWRHMIEAIIGLIVVSTIKWEIKSELHPKG